MNRKTTLIATALTGLAACSGGGSDTTTPPVAEVTMAAPTTVVGIGSNSLGLEASYDPNTTAIIVNGREYLTYNNGGHVYGPLTARRALPVTGDPDVLYDLAIHGQTYSGAGTVFQITSTVDAYEAVDGFENVFIQLTREGETAVPTSGSAQYAGSYMGNRYINGSGTFHNRGDRIFGEVLLTADFGDTGHISGTISKRTGGNEGSAWQDMELELATIDDGGFSGVVSGGGRIGQTTSDGQYSGLLTGAQADEAIGGLSILHENGDTEIGVFVAE